MKKYIFFSFALAFATHAFAQEDKECLVYTNNTSEAYEYGYRYDGQVECRRHISAGYPDVTDSLYYNAKGQNIEKAAFQEYNGLPYLVSKVVYTYYDNGLLATRDNYNTYNGPLEHSAHIVYEYDNEGKMTQQKQFWARDLENPFDIIKYNYNYFGYLESVEEYKPDNWDETQFALSSKIVYTYDNLGNRLNAKSYYSDSFGSYLVDVNEFYYDYYGNIEKIKVYDSSNKLRTSLNYEYDKDCSASNIIYPKTNEFDVLGGHPVKHKRTNELFYEMRNNELTLVYETAFEYNYLNALIPDAIQTATAFANLDLRYQGKRISTEGEGLMTITIYNAAGARVAEVSGVRPSFDAQTLPTGHYIVTLCQGDGHRISEKIQVK